MRWTLTDGTDTEQIITPIGGLTLIDPQGVVYDEARFDELVAQGATPEQARAGAAISGATVRLQRLVAGTYRNVLAGDPGIAPNVNPQVTGANGLYQWDVSEGTYRVTVTAPGYPDLVSRAVVIPPPVLDLHIPMRKPAVDNGGGGGGDTTRDTGSGSGTGLEGGVFTLPLLTRPGFEPLTLFQVRRRARMDRRGRVTVGWATCRKASGSCRFVRATLYASRTEIDRQKLVRIGSVRLVVPAGKRVALTAKLAERARALALRPSGFEAIVAVRDSRQGRPSKGRMTILR